MCEELPQISKNEKAKALAQTRHKRGNPSDYQANMKIPIITSDGMGKVQQKPELTPLDLAMPSVATDGLPVHGAPLAGVGNESHVETQWKG